MSDNIFKAKSVNLSTVEVMDVISDKFENLLQNIAIFLKPSRELSIVITKLQEACMWCNKGLSNQDYDNQLANEIEKKEDK